MNGLPVQVRHATSADLDQLIALERLTENAPHWPLAAYAAMLEPQPSVGPRRCLFVASEAETLKGFAVGMIPDGVTTAELESVAVNASARRAGIGRALCAAVLDWCRTQGATSIVLEVRANSLAAIALYTGLGFVMEGRRPRYYRDPEDDALILRLGLS